MRIRHSALRQLASICLVALCLAMNARYATAEPAAFEMSRDELRDYKNDASSAAAQAQAQYGGKVLNVSKSTSNGRTVYRVKLLLDSGRIKIVTIPE